MPQGMNGIELAREVRRICNGIRVLLASGNATDLLTAHGLSTSFQLLASPSVGRSSHNICSWSCAMHDIGFDQEYLY
jgi:hypothetical protein